jgi:hypothetical protein
MRAWDRWNRVRLAFLRARHRGLEVDPHASSNFAVARYNLAPDASLRIAEGAVTERIPGRLHFILYPGARVEVAERAWLRTEVGDVHIVAFEGARMVLGPECLVNGCHLSAKSEVSLARGAMVGPGSRVFDSDQHDLDDARRERSQPVSIGEYVWIASDCLVLRGSCIGAHSIVGSGSIVTGEVEPHTLVYGRPARPRGQVGDRSKAH